MYNEFVTSIKAALYDRAKSPLLGAWSLSWIAINHNIPIIIFSNADPIQKIFLIDKQLYPNFEYFLLHSIILPLLSTIFFIFVYPYPAKFAYEYSREKQRELKYIKQKIEDETPLTLEESRKIKAESFKIQLDLEKQLDQKDREISQLKEKITILINENEKLQKNENILPIIETEMLPPTLQTRKLPSDSISQKNSPPGSFTYPSIETVDELQIQILSILGNSKRKVSDEELFKAFSDIPSVKIKNAIDKLSDIGMNLVKYNHIQGSELTKQGREFVITNKIIK